MRSNRKRIFADVLSLDAWHDPIRVSGDTSAVYAELSFGQGRIGGDSEEFPYTFRVDIKRAILKIKVESPLRIERSTIARSIPENNTILTRIKSVKSQLSTSAGANAEFGTDKTRLAVSAAIAADLATTEEEQRQITSTLPEVLVTAIPGDGSNYSWEISPTFDNVLSGQPWNPISSPRLRIKNVESLLRLDAAILVSVHCALDDIHISDFERKDGLKNMIKGIELKSNYKVAMHQLKLVLQNFDLEPGKLDNRFSEVLLGVVSATVEK